MAAAGKEKAHGVKEAFIDPKLGISDGRDLEGKDQ